MAQVIASASRLKSGRSHRLDAVGAMLVLTFGMLMGAPAIPQPATATPPPTLQETGLYADLGG